jgi:hypothetical protein
MLTFIPGLFSITSDPLPAILGPAQKTRHRTNSNLNGSIMFLLTLSCQCVAARDTTHSSASEGRENQNESKCPCPDHLQVRIDRTTGPRSRRRNPPIPEARDSAARPGCPVERGNLRASRVFRFARDRRRPPHMQRIGVRIRAKAAGEATCCEGSRATAESTPTLPPCCAMRPTARHLDNLMAR